MCRGNQHVLPSAGREKTSSRGNICATGGKRAWDASSHAHLWGGKEEHGMYSGFLPGCKLSLDSTACFETLFHFWIFQVNTSAVSNAREKVDSLPSGQARQLGLPPIWGKHLINWLISWLLLYLSFYLHARSELSKEKISTSDHQTGNPYIVWPAFDHSDCPKHLLLPSCQQPADFWCLLPSIKFRIGLFSSRLSEVVSTSFIWLEEHLLGGKVLVLTVFPWLPEQTERHLTAVMAKKQPYISGATCSWKHKAGEIPMHSKGYFLSVSAFEIVFGFWMNITLILLKY